MIRVITVVAVAALVSACSVVRVREQVGTADPNKVPGIPFYGRTAKFKQVSVYHDTWLRATLSVAKKIKNENNGQTEPLASAPQTYVRDLAKCSCPNAELDAIKAQLLRTGAVPLGEAEPLIARFNKLRSVDMSRPLGPVVVSNAITTEWIVDHTRKYYLNAAMPWFGTGSLSQDLNQDGTLAKSTTTLDSKVGEGLSALLPLKEYLTGEFVKPVEDLTDDDKATLDTPSLNALVTRATKSGAQRNNLSLVYTLTLAIEEVGFEYTLESQLADTKPDLARPIPFDTLAPPGVNYSRKPIGGSAVSEDEAAENTVGISGAVTFPKGWGSSPAEAPKK